MINRAELKTRAKNAFKGKYWWVFTACLIVAVITSLLGGGGGSIGTGVPVVVNNAIVQGAIAEPDVDIVIDGVIVDGEIYTQESQRFEAGFAIVLVLILLFIFAIMIVVFFVSLIKGVLVLNPLNIGLKSYFLNNRENKADIKDLFSVFSKGNYGKTVGTVFTTNLIVSLWTLLFIIPGIYHQYVYWMVPYICAERPCVTSSEARKLSRAITNGYKLEIFIMELSFIGWRILGNAVIFGNYFVEPYVQATYAELYVELRDRAIASGKITAEQVGLVKEVSAPEVFEPESYNVSEAVEVVAE